MGAGILWLSLDMLHLQKMKRATTTTTELDSHFSQLQRIMYSKLSCDNHLSFHANYNPPQYPVRNCKCIELFCIQSEEWRNCTPNRAEIAMNRIIDAIIGYAVWDKEQLVQSTHIANGFQMLNGRQVFNRLHILPSVKVSNSNRSHHFPSAYAHRTNGKSKTARQSGNTMRIWLIYVSLGNDRAIDPTIARRCNVQPARACVVMPGDQIQHRIQIGHTRTTGMDIKQ